MSYILNGVLRGRLGPNEAEPLADVTVRLYRLRTSTSEQAAEGGFAVLSEQQEKEKDFLLFAMGRTDARGAFRIDLSEPTVLRPGIPVPYAGEPIEVDVYCRRAPGQVGTQGREVQFSLGVFYPRWDAGTGGAAEFSRVLTEAEWGEVRAQLDAWVISGRVVAGAAEAPQPNARVLAYDADMVKDDLLGTAVTDAEGRFRIDYASRDFQDQHAGVNLEKGGPEVYFRVENARGEILLDEKRSASTRGGRKGVGGCLYAQLSVVPPVEIPVPAM